jgi:hypothetical protein
MSLLNQRTNHGAALLLCTEVALGLVTPLAVIRFNSDNRPPKLESVCLESGMS